MTTALDTADPLAHALFYAELGWRVIPIPPGGKRPELERWQDIATTDRSLIADWFRRWPGHGIGLATGHLSGVFALDVDPGHGGDDTLATLEAQHGKLPDTVEAITGGGGRHLLFRWPELAEGQDLRNSAGRLGLGLDIRGEGGQIVVAPSVHPDTGRRYEWEASSRPGEQAIAEAPAWLLALLVQQVAVMPDGQVPAAIDTRFAWDAYEAGGNAEAVRLLEAHGWHSPRVDRHGVTYMVRPGKTSADGAGCSIGKIRPGTVYCFTSEAPPLEAEHGYRLPELLAVLEHDGNRAVADAALVAVTGLAPTYAFDPKVMELYIAVAQTTAAVMGTAEAVVDERDAYDFLAEPEPPYDWLVPDLIERGDRLILTGPEGGGKSTLLRQMAVQLAAGIHPFGGDDFEPVRCLIIDCENSHRQIRRKLRGLVERCGQRLGRGSLWVVPKPEGIDLATADDHLWLWLIAERVQPDLLIIGPIYKMSNGDPTEETTAKPIIAVLDEMRVRHDCAVLIEAHTPSESSGAKRLERPYGASIWRRWPEFGLFLDPAGPLRHWRGARDERAWPISLERGKGPTSWPWQKATAKDITFAAMMEVQRAAPKRLSVREIATALEARGLAKGTGISKSNVDAAIKANQGQWDAMIDQLDFDTTPAPRPWG